MKHLKLYENFETQDYKGLELDPKTHGEYIGKLEKLVSFPELYRVDFKAWSYIIDDVPFENFDPFWENIHTPKSKYESLRREYQLIKENLAQHALNVLMQALSGEFPESDFEEMNNQPIEWWLAKFKGMPREIAYMAKSVCDNELIFSVDFIRVK